MILLRAHPTQEMKITNKLNSIIKIQLFVFLFLSTNLSFANNKIGPTSNTKHSATDVNDFNGKTKQEKKEEIVAKRVQVLITMISCLQLVIALPVVVQALTQPRMSEIQRKIKTIRTVKRNLGGFLDLNNLSYFFVLNKRQTKKPHRCGALN